MKTLKFLSIFLLSLFFASCNPKNTDVTEGNYSTNKPIPPNEAMQHQKNYHEYFLATNEKISIDSVANHGWINIDDLELFITQAKEKALKNNKSLTGLRIYIGKYSEGVSGDLTFFLSPTVVPNVRDGYFQGAGQSQSSVYNNDDTTQHVLNLIGSGYPPKFQYPY